MYIPWPHKNYYIDVAREKYLHLKIYLMDVIIITVNIMHLPVYITSEIFSNLILRDLCLPVSQSQATTY